MIAYTEVTFFLEPLLPAREVLIYELGEACFDTFENTPEGLKAYIPQDKFSTSMLDNLMAFQIPDLVYRFEIKEIPAQNWNAEWEKDFHPIVINEECMIRAPFHAVSGGAYDVIISPKMSFGTGHHETTFLMASALFKSEIKGKTLLDMGSGTGILAILASKLGASAVHAIDIEEWACENAEENKVLNATPNILVEKGSAELLQGRSYQVILANINRNVLLAQISEYARVLKPGGLLLLSGFFVSDADILVNEAEKRGLAEELREQKNDWCLLKLKRA